MVSEAPYLIKIHLITCTFVFCGKNKIFSPDGFTTYRAMPQSFQARNDLLRQR